MVDVGYAHPYHRGDVVQAYMRNADGSVNITVTISPEHRALFEQAVAEIKDKTLLIEVDNDVKIRVDKNSVVKDFSDTVQQ